MLAGNRHADMIRRSLVPFFVRHTVVKNLQKASELPKGHVQLECHVTTLLCSSADRGDICYGYDGRVDVVE